LPRRALVTGGAGFIGSHLVERLLRDGWEVTTLDDLSSGDLANLPRHSGERIRIVTGNVTDPRAAADACQGKDVVFHLAAVSSIQAAEDHPGLMKDVNVGGTRNVLERSAEARVGSFVFASSAAIYGRLPPPLKESQVPSPISKYGRSKALAEEICFRMAKEENPRVTVLRFFNVYGERSVGGEYAGVISKFAAAILKGEQPVIYGTGRQSRDFVYIDDVVDALVRAGTSIAPRERVYNVGTGKATTILQLMRLEARLLGRRTQPKAQHKPPREGDIDQSFADITSVSTDLGYSPSVPFREGLRRYLKWFGRNG